jgi:glycogen operon protein
MLRSLDGNNNPYNLDAPPNWLDWSNLTAQADFVAFAKSAIALRRAHAALRPQAFRDGTDHDGNGRKDIAFVDASGAEIAAPRASDRFVAYMLDGDEAGDAAHAVYVAYRFDATPVTVTLPPSRGGWQPVLDTGAPLPPSGAPVQATATLGARSVVVLVDPR